MTTLLVYLVAMVGQVHAYGYDSVGGLGVSACVVPTPEGKLQFVSGVPGCTEKTRKTIRNGEEVTYQQVLPAFDPTTGKFAPQTQTSTIQVKRDKGEISSVAISDGENVDKSGLTQIVEFNTDASSPMTIARMMAVVRKAGAKPETFVTFDQNLCARMKAVAGNPHLLKMAEMCSQALDPLQEVISEFSKKLAKENKKLGFGLPVYSLDPNSMIPGGSPMKPAFQEARGGSFMSLAMLMNICGVTGQAGSAYTNPGPGSPHPIPKPYPDVGEEDAPQAIPERPTIKGEPLPPRNF